MSAQNAARPAHGEQPACGPWTLMRVRPPPSVRIFRAAAFPGTISLKLSTSCSATYLLVTVVRRPPPLEVEVAPVSASRLLKERRGHVHLLRPGGNPCFLEHASCCCFPGAEDGGPGEGQRLTPHIPHNGGRPTPPGTAPHHPHGTQPPQGMQAKGTVLGPHTHTPAPAARCRRTSTACPVGGQSGEGERPTSDAPHN